LKLIKKSEIEDLFGAPQFIGSKAVQGLLPWYSVELLASAELLRQSQSSQAMCPWSM